jgi:MerR family copper efflux transcriptional regulator
VHVETIRYYERHGLLPEPSRRASGYRQYSPVDVAYLRFIRRAKTLGFSLKEIKVLLGWRVEPTVGCRDVRAQAERKLSEVDAKIRVLEEMKLALQQMVAACSGQGPTSTRPILESLTTPESEEGGGQP